MITVVNKLTGEVLDLADDSPEAIKDSWLMLSETIKAFERAKDKLKLKVADLLDEKGTYDYGDYVFRQSIVQRQNYDKAVLRNVLDADTFDLLTVPDKPAIDRYIKENLTELGAASTELRNSMIAVGEPYSMIRLEKVKTDDH